MLDRSDLLRKNTPEVMSAHLEWRQLKQASSEVLLFALFSVSRTTQPSQGVGRYCLPFLQLMVRRFH